MIKFYEIYNIVQKRYNPKDKEHIAMKKTCFAYLHGKLNNEEKDKFFDYKNENYQLNCYILGITSAELLKNETNIEKFLKTLSFLDDGYHEGNRIAQQAFMDVASNSLYNDGKSTVFLKTIKQIPDYLNKYPEKFFRFDYSKMPASTTKKYINQWRKEKNIDDILIGRDMLILNCRSEVDYIVSVFTMILNKDLNTFMECISRFETPMLLNSLAHNIIYSNLESFFKIIKNAPPVIEEKTQKWNNSLILPVFTRNFLDWIEHFHRQMEANRIQFLPERFHTETEKTNKLLNAQIEKIIDIILDRKEDGTFFMECLFNNTYRYIFTRQGKNKGSLDDFSEFLKIAMTKKNISPYDIFKNITDLTSLASLLFVSPDSEANEQHLTLLKKILECNEKIHINSCNFHNSSMFDPIHYILAPIFTFGNYEKNWYDLWLHFEQKRRMYKSGFNNDYFLMNSSLYLLILGTIAVEKLIQEKKSAANFLGLIWHAIFTYYLMDKSLSDNFYKNIIPYIIVLYCATGSENVSIACEKIKLIIPDKSLLFATLALLEVNEFSFDFIPTDLKKLCINQLEFLDEINTVTATNNERTINRERLHKIIAKLNID